MRHTDWTLWWQDWLFGIPWWAAALALVGITPVAIWLIRGAIQGLWVNPFAHDWGAANFDLVVGSFGAGTLLMVVQRYAPDGGGFTHGWMYAVLNYGGIAAGFGFAMFKWWDERKFVEGWRARLGATSLYHVLVLMYMVSLFAVLFFNTFPIALRAAQHLAEHPSFAPDAIMPVTGWMGALVTVVVWIIIGSTYDVTHRTAPDGQSKFVYTSPEDGWRNIRRLFAWLKTQYRPAELGSRTAGHGNETELEPPLPFKLEVLPGWRWLLSPHPLLIFVTGVVLSPGIMELNDLLFVHGHFVPLNAQWLSALFDVALWGAVAIMAAMLPGLPEDSFPAWQLRRWPHFIVLLLPVGFGARHVWQEWDSIPMSARTGINYLYHNLFLFPFLGYTVFILLLTVLFMSFLCEEAYRSAWYWLGAVVSCALIGSWLWAGDFDRTHQYAPGGTPKAAFANPAHPWHGLIPQFFRWANHLVQAGVGPPSGHF